MRLPFGKNPETLITPFDLQANPPILGIQILYQHAERGCLQTRLRPASRLGFANASKKLERKLAVRWISGIGGLKGHNFMKMWR